MLDEKKNVSYCDGEGIVSDMPLSMQDQAASSGLAWGYWG